MIPETRPPASGDAVQVTPAELRAAMAVWLRTMPSHLWRPYLAMLEIDPKRRNPDERVDPRDVLADYIAGKFAQARWTAARVEGPRMVDTSTKPRP